MREPVFRKCRRAHLERNGLTAIETGLTSMAATLVQNFVNPRLVVGEILLLDICIIQDALKDKVKTNKRCSRVI